MTREEAIAMIDFHKNKLIDPVEMLSWTWLRVIIDNIDDGTWEKALSKAEGVLSR
jgi:hypothetical protein